MTQAPPVEAAEEAIRKAGNVCVFAYTVDFVPIEKLFISRNLKKRQGKASQSLIKQARQAPETLPPIFTLRSKPHPGFFAIAHGTDLFSAAKIARLDGLWAVIADEWIECVT